MEKPFFWVPAWLIALYLASVRGAGSRGQLPESDRTVTPDEEKD